MKAVILVLLLGLPIFATAQTDSVPKLPTPGRSLVAFIPARYDTLPGGRATGDLN